MSNRTGSLIRGVAVLLVILAILMNLQFIIIPSLSPYTFWIVVIAFGMMLFTSR